MSARLVVLASGEGSTLQAILDACRDPGYGAQVVVVGTDRPGVRALGRAADAGVETFVVRLEDAPSRAEFDARVLAAVGAHDPTVLVLAGYMKLLGPAVVHAFRTVNTHPSLLPAFPGVGAVQQALDAGVKVAGCTVHLVDEGVDTGPILAQRAVEVRPGDTAATLQARIQAVERVLYVEVIGDLARASAQPASAQPATAQPVGAR